MWVKVSFELMIGEHKKQTVCKYKVLVELTIEIIRLIDINKWQYIFL